jgi:hypothetical protein
MEEAQPARRDVTTDNRDRLLDQRSAGVIKRRKSYGDGQGQPFVAAAFRHGGWSESPKEGLHLLGKSSNVERTSDCAYVGWTHDFPLRRQVANRCRRPGWAIAEHFTATVRVARWSVTVASAIKAGNQGSKTGSAC